MAAQGKYISPAEMGYYTAVERFNDAVWGLDADALTEAVSSSTYQMCVEKASLLAVSKGGDWKVDAVDYLKAQQATGLVYKIQSVSPTTNEATLSLIKGTKIVSTLSVPFVTEKGQLKMDLSAQLTQEIASIKQTMGAQEAVQKQKSVQTHQMEQLLDDLDEAVSSRDEALFLSTVSDDTAELALLLVKLLPPAQGGSTSPTIGLYLDHLSMTVDELELITADAEKLFAEVLVHHPIGPTSSSTPGPPDVRVFSFVHEHGRLVLDLALALTEEVEKVAQQTGHVGPFAETAQPDHWVQECSGPADNCLALAESETDPEQAYEYSEIACDAGLAAGCVSMASILLTQGKAKHVKKAHKILERTCIAEADLSTWKTDPAGASIASEEACLMLADLLLAGDTVPARPKLAEQLYEKVCFDGGDQGCVAYGAIQLGKLRNVQPWGLDEEQEFDLVQAQFEMSCASAALRCIDLGNRILQDLTAGLWYGDAREAVLTLANEVLLNP